MLHQFSSILLVIEGPRGAYLVAVPQDIVLKDQKHFFSLLLRTSRRGSVTCAFMHIILEYIYIYSSKKSLSLGSSNKGHGKSNQPFHFSRTLIRR